MVMIRIKKRIAESKIPVKVVKLKVVVGLRMMIGCCWSKLVTLLIMMMISYFLNRVVMTILEMSWSI